MKKILKLVLAVTMCISLVNLTNSTTKAEDNEYKTILKGSDFNEIVKGLLTDNVKTIEFKNGDLPADGVDLSNNKDNSIKGKVEGDSFNIYVANGNKIKFNEFSSHMFSGLNDDGTANKFENIEYVKFNNIVDTSDVKQMFDMFCCMKSLKSLDLSCFDTSNVELMDHMFNGCKSLESIKFGDNFNTSKVESMEWMFRDCSSLKTLDLSKFSTEKVESTEAMFVGDKSLESIKFGKNFKTKEVTNMSAMFKNCSSLKTLDLFYFETPKVTNMSFMFDGDTLLNDITLGEKFNAEVVTTMEAMFQDCESLKTIYLDDVCPTEVENMSSMFRNCNSLQKLDLSSFITTSKLTNMSKMFTKCHSLTSLVFGDYFNTSNVTDMSSMFAQDSLLTSLDLGSFSTESVTNSYNMFKGCVLLSRIYASDDFDFSKVTNSEDMFLGCINLIGGKGTTIDIEHLDGSYGRIDKGEENPGYFTNCDELLENSIEAGKNGKFYVNGEIVENISYTSDGVVTMNGLNVDSNVNNKYTIVLPKNTKEIVVKGTNIITNVNPENGYPVLACMNDIKFTGSGTLTIYDVNNEESLDVNNITIDGPTLNVFGNAIGTEGRFAALNSNRIVINSGVINAFGTVGINIVERNYEWPSLIINGGTINTYGTYAGLMETVSLEEEAVIDAKAKGRALLIDDFSDVKLKEIKDFNDDYYRFAYQTDDDIARLVILTKSDDPTPIEPKKDDEMKYDEKYGFVLEFNEGKHLSATAHIEANYYTEEVTVHDSKEEYLWEGEDYDVEEGSIKVIFKPEFLSKLSAGVHTYTININNSTRDIKFNVTINVKKVSPKDESCEKVIGPTWHWNNKKGICEDTGVVKTYTR